MTKLHNLKISRPIVFFDLEATGTNPQIDRIVEICIAKLMPGGESEVKTRRVNPGIPIPAETTQIHGLSDKDVANEPSFSAIAASLNLYLENCDIAGYNIIRFDIPLLCNEFKRAGYNFSMEGRKIIDAQVIFHKMEPRTLSAAYSFFCGKNLEDAHSAKADVLATVAVLDAELEKYPILPRDIDELHDFCNPSDPKWIDSTGKFKWNDNNEAVIAFGKNKGMLLKDIASQNPNFLSWMARMDFAEDAKTGKFPAK
jgi:DNA polymerase-3 subunit epsilon